MVDDQARDAASAVALIEQQAAKGITYDVAVVDMLMPGKDGLQFAKELKSHPAGSLVRLVILTSLIQRGHAELARQAGFVGYLTKPVRHDQLSNCLRTVLGLSPPASEEHPTSTPAPAPPLITRHTLAETQSAPRILVAEDNLINQKLTVRMLEKLGYQSDVVENGQEALDAMARRSYVVLLMDCQMPVIDGFEATKLIRQREAAARESADAGSTLAHHIPIIALTANAMHGDREHCLAAGMDDYLTKPLRKEDLKGLLDRWIPATASSSPVSAVGGAAGSGAADNAQPLPVIFDRDSMLRNIGGDRELLSQLIELFLQHYQSIMEKIRVALAGNDQGAIEQAAHLLKGTAGNLCAMEVVSAAGQLEALGRLGTLLDAPVVYTQLEVAVLRLVRVLEMHRRRHQDAGKSAA
jgi:two-component system sensor histidine kinase/response regulator